ncbi:hypothetical protein [Haliea sp. E17]|uniref:hypothetical protein n=1 Tax=Haliea sp. E17 TaxID=3401576 RepID=UPI003AAB3163
MPFVKRNSQGEVVAVSLEWAADFDEELPAGSVELVTLLGHASADDSLADTDQDFIRVLEDVVDLLIDKGVFLFTELPGSAQEKILKRQKLRRGSAGSLNLLGDD